MSKVERECGVCGSRFSVLASRIKHGRGKHCSPSCQYEARRRSKEVRTLICLGCGKEFTRDASYLRNCKNKGNGKFCSRACRDKHWFGELNPLYQGVGKKVHYGHHWQAAKRLAKKRDGYQCQHCGVKKNLDVHHISPIRIFNPPDIANHPDNLITLCRSCHRTEEARWRTHKIDDNVAVCFKAGGYAHELAKSKGMV